jgi:hypothetical protein
VIEFSHALEEILFTPRLQLRVLDRLFQVPAPLCEIKLLAEAEEWRVCADDSTPKTRGPMAREKEGLIDP